LNARPGAAAKAVRLAWLGVLIGATSSGALAGQQPAGVSDSGELPARLTLERALSLAARYSPSYRRALADVEAASAGVRESWGQFLPRLDASLVTDGGTTNSTLGKDEFGRPIQGNANYRSSGSSENIGLSWLLFSGGAHITGLRSARATRRASEASARSALADARATVTEAYAQAVYDARVVALDSALLASARDRLAATEKLLAVGGADPTDVLGAQSDVASQQQALEAGRAQMLKDRLALATAIGVSADPGAFEPADTAIEVFDPTSLDADSLLTAARLSNPALLAAQAQADAADADVGARRGAYWPSISAGLGYGRSVGSPDYGSLFDLGAQQRAFSFSVQVSVPLFQGLQTSGAVAQASANATAAHEQARQQRLQLEQAVRGGLIDLRNAYRGVQLARRAAELSRRRVTMAQQSYEQGGGSFVSLQQVIGQATQVEQSALSAALAFAQARAELERRVGRPVGPRS
jgi:outer membrane protein TolC